jgi:hypothetical protein
MEKPSAVINRVCVSALDVSFDLHVGNLAFMSIDQVQLQFCLAIDAGFSTRVCEINQFDVASSRVERDVCETQIAMNDTQCMQFGERMRDFRLWERARVLVPIPGTNRDVEFDSQVMAQVLVTNQLLHCQTL